MSTVIQMSQAAEAPLALEAGLLKQESAFADRKPLTFKKIQIRRVKTNIVGGRPGVSTSGCGGEGCCDGG
ncbi:MAG: hypothetical protein ACT4QB_17565 [Gammaproteobacteria bacterium]